MSMLTSIDRVAWLPAAVVSTVLRNIRSVRRCIDRPLIVRPGGLGDLVVATAAAEDLGLDPRDLDWVIEKRSAVWAKYLGLSYWCYDGSPTALRPLLTASRALCVNLEQRYGLAASFSHAATAQRGRHVGFASNRGSVLYSTRVPYDPFDQHELRAFTSVLAAALGTTPKTAGVRTRRFPSAGHSVVSVSGTASPSRSWSALEWIEMIRRFAHRAPDYITAAPDDMLLARQIASSIGASCQVLTGDWSELCEYVRGAERVFTVDGGMVHVASHFGVPVDAVFTAGRSAKWQPWSEGSTTIRRTDLSCQPCTVFGAVPCCHWNYACKQRSEWRATPCR